MTDLQNHKCPVAHLSFSSLQEYCKDRQAWNRHYIKRIWSDKKPVAMLIGEGAHYIIEQIYKNDHETIESAAERFFLLIEDRIEEGVIDWKDPENYEKELEKIKQTIPTIAEYAMEYIREKTLVDVEEVEPTYLSKIQGSDIMFKAKMDLITKSNVIYDWKFVAAFSDAEYIKPVYIIQGIGYALARADTKKKLPKKVIFLEVKKSKNRNGSPQWKEIIIDVTPERIKLFEELYSRVSMELMGESLVQQGLYIPNPFQFFGWEDGWTDFVEEVLGANPRTGEIVEEKKEEKPKKKYITLNKKGDILFKNKEKDTDSDFIFDL